MSVLGTTCLFGFLTVRQSEEKCCSSRPFCGERGRITLRLGNHWFLVKYHPFKKVAGTVICLCWSYLWGTGGKCSKIQIQSSRVLVCHVVCKQQLFFTLHGNHPGISQWANLDHTHKCFPLWRHTLHRSKVTQSFHLTNCGGSSLTMFVVVFRNWHGSDRLLGLSMLGGPAPWQPWWGQLPMPGATWALHACNGSWGVINTKERYSQRQHWDAYCCSLILFHRLSKRHY